MKIYIFLALFLVTGNSFGDDVEKKLWCIVFFKKEPNKVYLLESRFIGIVKTKTEDDFELYTLEGKIVGNSKYKTVNTYVVKSTACTDDLKLAKENLEIKNKTASQNTPEKSAESSDEIAEVSKDEMSTSPKISEKEEVEVKEEVTQVKTPQKENAKFNQRENVQAPKGASFVPFNIKE